MKFFSKAAEEKHSEEKHEKDLLRPATNELTVD